MKTKERVPGKRTVNISKAARLWTPPQGRETEIPQLLRTSPASCLGRRTHCLPGVLAEATSAVFNIQESISGGRNSRFLGCQNLESRTYPGKKIVHPGSVTGWSPITNLSCSDFFIEMTKKCAVLKQQFLKGYEGQQATAVQIPQYP